MRSSHARVLDGLAAAVASHPSGAARLGATAPGAAVVTFRPRVVADTTDAPGGGAA